MAKDLYLGRTSTAFVNTPDGIVFVEKGGKLPALASGEEKRLREAGTPLYDEEQPAVPQPSPAPSLEEEADEPARPPDDTPFVAPIGEVHDPLLAPPVVATATVEPRAEGKPKSSRG